MEKSVPGERLCQTAMRAKCLLKLYKGLGIMATMSVCITVGRVFGSCESCIGIKSDSKLLV